MKYLLINICEFLSSFGPFLAVLLLLRRKNDSNARRYWIPVLFALYVTAVFHVTWPGTLYDHPHATAQDLFRRVNLIPFSRDIHIPGYFLNVLMFVPFGMLLPLLGRKPGRILPLLAGGFGFSLLIELSQLLSERGTDVDDLIMNTLGAALGFLLYRFWDKRTASRFQAGCAPGEPAVFLLVLWLGRFLLFNHRGLIDLLYP